MFGRCLSTERLLLIFLGLLVVLLFSIQPDILRRTSYSGDIKVSAVSGHLGSSRPSWASISVASAPSLPSSSSSSSSFSSSTSSFSSFTQTDNNSWVSQLLSSPASTSRSLPTTDPLTIMFRKPCILMADTRALFSDTVLNYAITTTVLYALRHNYKFLYYHLRQSNDSSNTDNNDNKKRKKEDDMKTKLACSHTLHGPRAAPWCKLLALLHGLTLTQNTDGYENVVGAVLNQTIVANKNPLCSAVIWIDSDGLLKGPTSLLTRFYNHQSGPKERGLSWEKHHVFIGNNQPYDWFPNTGFFVAKNSYASQEFFFRWWDDNIVPDYYTNHDYEQRWLVKIFFENLYPYENLGFLSDLAPMNSSRWPDDNEPTVHVCSDQLRHPEIIEQLVEVFLKEIIDSSPRDTQKQRANATTWNPSKIMDRKRAQELLPTKSFEMLDDHERSQKVFRAVLQSASQQKLFHQFSLDGYKFDVKKLD